MLAPFDCQFTVTKSYLKDNLQTYYHKIKYILKLYNSDYLDSVTPDPISLNWSIF